MFVYKPNIAPNLGNINDSTQRILSVFHSIYHTTEILLTHLNNRVNEIMNVCFKSENTSKSHNTNNNNNVVDDDDNNIEWNDQINVNLIVIGY